MLSRIKNKNIFLIVFFSTAGLVSYFYIKDKNDSSTIPAIQRAQNITAQRSNSKNTNSNAHKQVFSGDKKAGFESITQEVSLQKLPFKGTMPSWLKGVLIGTGPALFEMGSTKASYWFNGLAMLQAFYFDGKSISFQNAFLDSVYYQRCQANGKFDSDMASGAKPKGFFSRLANAFNKPDPYDNGNLAVALINGSFIALTETTLGVVFDPKTLKTNKPFNLNEHLEGHMTTAQFQYDRYTKAWYNYMTTFAKTSSYTLYKITEDNKPKLISSISVKKPSYMRSFAMTKNYLILVEIPFVINPIDLVLGTGSFIEKIKWKPKLGTNFIIFNKYTGEQVETISTKTPFFIFNTINAFEDKDTIIIDAISYANSDVINTISLEALTSINPHEFEPSFITRFALNTTHKNVIHKRLSSQNLEFPTINQAKYSMEPYTYVYGIGTTQPYKFPHQLIKTNIKTGASQTWSQQGCYANKPTFIPTPQAKNEDDGVLLSVVFDSIDRKSFLLILDAKKFIELGRAELPCPIPLGLVATFSHDNEK